MGAGHNHGPANYNWAFAIGVGLNLGFVVIEVIFGWLADSLALLADAGHNLSDVLGLLLAWGASALAGRSPTRRRTYGWRSSSILAALLNAVLLLVAVGGIAWEAIRRLGEPSPVAGQTVIWVALVGMVINTATALLFLAGRKGDLNVRGAFLHMAADAGVSAGVVVAGIAILATGWSWLDPAISLTIAAFILVSTWVCSTTRSTWRSTRSRWGSTRPPWATIFAICPVSPRSTTCTSGGVSTTETALTVHLLKPEPADDDALLARATRDLHDEFGIEHVTVQWERSGQPRPCVHPCS